LVDDDGEEPVAFRVGDLVDTEAGEPVEAGVGELLGDHPADDGCDGSQSIRRAVATVVRSERWVHQATSCSNSMVWRARGLAHGISSVTTRAARPA
jgi:hypothetical protein